VFRPDEFGVLAVYVATLGIATTIGSLRLEQAIGLPRSQQEAFAVLVAAVLTSGIFALVVGVPAVMFPTWIFRGDDVTVPALVAWLLPVGVVFGCAYQALSVWALRTKAVKPLAATRIAQGVGTAAAQIGAGLLGLGAVGLTAGHALGQSIGAGALISRTVRGTGLRRPLVPEVRASLGRYRRFPLLATPAALLNSTAQQVPIFLLAPAFGAAVAGMYFFSVRITMAPLDIIGRSIGQVFYAEAIAYGQERPAALRRLVLATSAKSFLLGLVPGLVIACLAPVLFRAIFGNEWSEAGEFSQVMAIMLIANFAVSPISQIFLIVERQHYSVVLNILKLLTAASSMLVPISLGLGATKALLVYSCAMAGYYLFILLVALMMLSAMTGRIRTPEVQ